MKITIEMDSFDELKEACEKMGYLDAVNLLKGAAAKQKETTANAEEIPANAEEATADIGKLRSDTRRALSKVNKKAGEKIAQEWIKEAGIESFSDTTDADALAALLKRAEEYLA